MTAWFYVSLALYFLGVAIVAFLEDDLSWSQAQRSALSLLWPLRAVFVYAILACGVFDTLVRRWRAARSPSEESPK